MAGMIRKSLDMPQETRIFEAGMGKLELISTEAGPAGRATFQPGRQWSRHVKPIAQTGSCQPPHTGYFISGRMKIRMDDRQETGFGPGDFAVIPPSHDAWVIGDQPCVVIDWQGFADYAKDCDPTRPAQSCRRPDVRSFKTARLPWPGSAARPTSWTTASAAWRLISRPSWPHWPAPVRYSSPGP